MTSLIAILVLVLPLLTRQSDERSPYLREGDRIEQEFRTYRDRLNAFFTLLRSMIEQQPPGTTAALPRLQQQDAPPPASSRYGYGVLPRLIDGPPPANPPVSVFSYSWPITDGYIAGENIKLDQAESQLRNVSTTGASGSGASTTDLIAN